MIVAGTQFRNSYVLHFCVNILFSRIVHILILNQNRDWLNEIVKLLYKIQIK